MADLVVDTTVLREAGEALGFVYDELIRAGTLARPERSVVADERLRDRLEEFADSWNDRRREIAAAVRELGEAAAGAGDAYDGVERELVDALVGR